MWLTPTSLCFLLVFGIAFDVHSSPSLHLFLPSSPFTWNSLSIFSVSKVKSRHLNEFLRPVMEFAVQAVGHAEFSAVLAWSPRGTSCPLPPGLVSFVVSDTISSSETRKKEEFISVWLLSFVPYVNCGITYLHVLYV